MELSINEDERKKLLELIANEAERLEDLLRQARSAGFLDQIEREQSVVSGLREKLAHDRSAE